VATRDDSADDANTETDSDLAKDKTEKTVTHKERVYNRELVFGHIARYFLAKINQIAGTVKETLQRLVLPNTSNKKANFKICIAYRRFHRLD